MMLKMVQIIEIKLDFEDNTDEDDVIIFVEFRLTDDIYFEPTNPE